MNKVYLLGRLTADPELREGQVPVCRFTVATDRRTKDGGADFIRCVAFDKKAETISRFLSKGRRICIDGHIQTGSYEDRDGKKVYTTDVIVDQFDFCDSRAEAAESPQEAPRPQTRTNTQPTRQKTVQARLDGFLDIPDGMEEELPFN